jgi:hypothetical protein
MSLFFDFFLAFLPESDVVAELSVLDGAVALASGEAGAVADGSVAGAAGTGAVLSVVGEAGVGAGIVDCGVVCGDVGAGLVCAMAAPETPISSAAAIGRIFMFISPYVV